MANKWEVAVSRAGFGLREPERYGVRRLDDNGQPEWLLRGKGRHVSRSTFAYRKTAQDKADQLNREEATS